MLRLSRRLPRRARFGLLIALFALLPLTSAGAHVKWFADFSFADPPRQLGEVLTPLFFALAALSFVVIGALVFVDARIKNFGWYQRINRWLEDRQPHAVTVLRVGLGATLLLSWQADRMLTPDIPIAHPLIGWAQFVIALLLLLPITTPLAGLGTLILYGIGILQVGGFYMLDYAAFVGVGVYLLVSQAGDRRIRGLGIPALYATLGFSLCWLGLEKLIYPQWGLYILEQNPQLTLGLDPNFFLKSAAFVEISLGYLLIIGLLERPISLAITLVFFTTTLVFGRTEIIGHTILHAALIVFLLEGKGQVYPAPLAIHRRLGWRTAFAAVNFVIVLFALLIPYSWQATNAYQAAQAAQAIEASFLLPPLP